MSPMKEKHIKVDMTVGSCIECPFYVKGYSQSGNETQLYEYCNISVDSYSDKNSLTFIDNIDSICPFSVFETLDTKEVMMLQPGDKKPYYDDNEEDY